MSSNRLLLNADKTQFTDTAPLKLRPYGAIQIWLLLLYYYYMSGNDATTGQSSVSYYWLWKCITSSCH